MEQGSEARPPCDGANEPRVQEASAAGEHLRWILDSAHEAFVSMDAGGFVTDWNRAAEETFGWAQADAVGKVLADLIIPPALRDAHWDGLKHYLATGEGPVLSQRLELSALHRDGHAFPVELTISALEVGGRIGFHAFLRDISDRKRAEAEREELVAKLAALAKTDELTDLWNRRGWDELLGRELARAKREEGHLCVAVLDLDGFKAYNDANGHQAGDELLRAVAETWRTKLRATDVLARYGGDEFAVAFPAWPIDLALPVVERLRTHIPAAETCSAGLAAWNRESAEELVARADAALYAAKRAGSDRTVVAS